MDKKRSVLNISVSIFSRLVLLISALIVRRLLIQYIGNNVNGLNSLYTSIIGMLSVAELGVGSAIVYSMYKPILNGETEKTAALYGLYKKLYFIIGFVIFIAGLIVMPFLPIMIEDYKDISINVYSSFFLTLISVVISYLYSAKTSLIEAHKNNYITTGIMAIANLLRHILQIIVILIWSSYTMFLFCQVICTLIAWGLTEIIVRRKYKNIIEIKEQVPQEIKNEIIRNTKALFMHRIGSILVSSIDSVIISIFIGVVALGKFSNYTYIANILLGTIALFFSPVTSIVGHLCAAGDPQNSKKYFDYFYYLNFILGVFFFLGYYAVIDYVVVICFGSGLEIPRFVSFIISYYHFMSFMRKTLLLFRDASATYYYDRWVPMLESLCNLILSTLFVYILPEDYKVAGVIVATIVIFLTIIFTVGPYYVFKYIFQQSPRTFYIRNYSYVLIFGLSLGIMSYFMTDKGMIVNGLISCIISFCVLILVAIVDKSFRQNSIKMIKWGCSNIIHIINRKPLKTQI